jgi:hypothetical protein
MKDFLLCTFYQSQSSEQLRTMRTRTWWEWSACCSFFGPFFFPSPPACWYSWSISA